MGEGGESQNVRIVLSMRAAQYFFTSFEIIAKFLAALEEGNCVSFKFSLILHFTGKLDRFAGFNRSGITRQEQFLISKAATDEEETTDSNQRQTFGQHFAGLGNATKYRFGAHFKYAL